MDIFSQAMTGPFLPFYLYYTLLKMFVNRIHIIFIFLKYIDINKYLLYNPP